MSDFVVGMSDRLRTLSFLIEGECSQERLDSAVIEMRKMADAIDEVKGLLSRTPDTVVAQDLLFRARLLIMTYKGNDEEAIRAEALKERGGDDNDSNYKSRNQNI